MQNRGCRGAWLVKSWVVGVLDSTNRGCQGDLFFDTGICKQKTKNLCPDERFLACGSQAFGQADAPTKGIVRKKRRICALASDFLRVGHKLLGKQMRRRREVLGKNETFVPWRAISCT